MNKRNRTENVGIEFENGIAKIWAFDVPEAFRSSLDIVYMQRADREANAALKAELGRSLESRERQWKMVWTRGDPPAYSFAEGEIFYDPPGVRAMAWLEALKVLRRTVQVMRANPDPEALPHKANSKDDEARQEEPRTTASGGSGWVTFQVLYYEDGKITHKEIADLRQLEFAEFLRTGATDAEMYPSPLPI